MPSPAHGARPRPTAAGRRTLALAIALSLVGGLTCRDRHPTAPAPDDPSLRVTPVASLDTLRLIVEETYQLSAMVENPVGKQLPNKQHTSWVSSRPEVASVDQTGLVTALDTGVAFVIAVHKKAADSVRVRVVPIPVASVVLLPQRDTIERGEARQFSVTLLDHEGRELTGRIVEWTSSDVAVATIASSGLATGVIEGTTTITAISDGTSASSELTVRDAVASVEISPRSLSMPLFSQSQWFVATLRDRSGQVLTGRPVTWEWIGSGVAWLSPRGDTAFIAPISFVATPASARLRAVAEGKADTVMVTITRALVSSVRVQGPGSLPALNTGCGWQYSDGTVRAEALDLHGNLIPGPHVVAWSLSGLYTGILPSAQTILVTAMTPGTGRATATIEGVSGFTQISVRRCATNEVTPADSTIAVGQTVQLTSRVASIFGFTYVSPPARADIVWSSSNPSVATVDQGGLVVGRSAGTATISASINKDPYGLGPVATGQATITVTPPQVAHLEITGPSEVIAQATGCGYPPETQVRNAVTAYDAAGQRLTPQGSTWSVDPLGVVHVAIMYPPEVRDTALLIGIAPGLVTVRAAMYGLQAERELRSRSCTITSVVPASAQLRVGETLELSPDLVTVFGAAPLPYENQGTFWQSSAPAIAEVSPDGVVTAKAPGTATISLTAFRSTGQATITVVAP